MTDATHIPSRTAEPPSLERFFTFLAKLAEIDPMRRQLSLLSEMSDAEVAAKGTTRTALVRQIIGPRGTF